MINLISRVLPRSMMLKNPTLTSTMVGKATFSTDNLNHAYFSQQEPANSPIQDRISTHQIAIPRSFYFAVFDGHGGHLVSQYASKNLHLILQAKLNKVNKNQLDIKRCLTESFEQLQNNILMDFKRAPNSKMITCGSCALVSLIIDKRLYVANAGDCEGILVKQDGQVTNINRRHNIAQKQEQIRLSKLFPGESDLAVMSPNGGCYLKGRLQPTFSLGDFYLKYKEYNVTGIRNFTGPYVEHRPQINTFQISGDDKYLVLATDGLWQELSHQQVGNILLVSQKPALSKVLLSSALQKAASMCGVSVDQLKKLRNRRNYHDDISFIIVDLKSLS